MIGVIANPSEFEGVQEFFELFKTSWEVYRGQRQYDVLLCTGDCETEEANAKLIVIYSGKRLRFDQHEKVELAEAGSRPRVLEYRGNQLPVYGNSIAFREASCALVDQASRDSLMHLHRSGSTVVARIGYDLFGEIHTLLAEGQPSAYADFPTLETHIALLRDLIVENGIPLIEIPPVPEGYRFIACLTHDVDHPSVRRHKCDHTMLGFLYRAVIGSLVSIIRGCRPIRYLLANWAAAAKLPFVHLGLAKDFWADFDRYFEIDNQHCSTFFVIPFEGHPGRNENGRAPSQRASAYGATDITAEIGKLVHAGCEIGLHGIDAWIDTAEARREKDEIARIIASEQIGARMHWLYFNERSPVVLEGAGVAYDSTVGYNDNVGYRAGTSQVYKPFGATRLLELPLHIMDTALFLPGRMGLSFQEAARRVTNIVDNAVRFGGVITINWHDRSIAPERCWGDFYQTLVKQLERQGAWFATAAETVSWFRNRRSATIEHSGGDAPCIQTTIRAGKTLPALQLRVHNAAAAQRSCEAQVASESPAGLRNSGL